jgi:hypothetical protein
MQLFRDLFKASESAQSVEFESIERPQINVDSALREKYDQYLEERRNAGRCGCSAMSFDEFAAREGRW